MYEKVSANIDNQVNNKNDIEFNDDTEVSIFFDHVTKNFTC